MGTTRNPYLPTCQDGSWAWWPEFGTEWPEACSQDLVGDGECNQYCTSCAYFYDSDKFDGGDCGLFEDFPFNSADSFCQQVCSDEFFASYTGEYVDHGRWESTPDPSASICEFYCACTTDFTTGSPTTSKPSFSPTTQPTTSPTQSPSPCPTSQPTSMPTSSPSSSPSTIPSGSPSVSPTVCPTRTPSKTPSFSPSRVPSANQSKTPSQVPSKAPVETPYPTENPSNNPSNTPTFAPSKTPSKAPSDVPSLTPIAFTGTCASRRYVSISDQVTDSWCRTECFADEEACYESGCECLEDQVGGSAAFSIVIAVMVLSALL